LVVDSLHSYETVDDVRYLVMLVMSVLVVFSENTAQYTRYPQDCVQAPDEKCTCNTTSGVEQYDNRISL
jgi:hypothetical protein